MALSKPQEIFLTPQKMDESFSKSILGLADGRIHLNPEKPVSCWEEVNSPKQFLLYVKNYFRQSPATRLKSASRPFSSAAMSNRLLVAVTTFLVLGFWCNFKK
jgi:hypothetical protein